METNMPKYTQPQENAIANAFAVITKQHELEDYHITQPIFSLRHIHQYIHNDIAVAGLREALLSNQKLRKIYDDMMVIWQENANIFYCDDVIAADDGAMLHQRHGNGFVISMKPSSAVCDEIYINISIEEWHEPPTHIMVTHNDGMIEKFALNEFDDNNISMMIADVNSPLVQLLQDKTNHKIALMALKNEG